MSVLDSIKDEILNSTEENNSVNNNETTNDLPASNEEVVADTGDKPNEPLAEGENEANLTDNKVNNEAPDGETAKPNEEVPAQVPPKPEKRTYTQQEQFDYALRKRMKRESRKYESEIEALKKEIEELKNPKKPITRDQFNSDEEFVNAHFNAIVDSKMAKQKEEFEAQRMKENEIREQQEEFSKRVLENFGNFDTFNKVVEPALSNGLSELIDSNPAVNEYITKNPNGVKMIYELASNEDSCRKVFGATTVWDQYYALKRIEEKLTETPRETPKETSIPSVTTKQVTTPTKPIGRVGSGSKSPADFNFDDDSWLIKTVRRAY